MVIAEVLNDNSISAYAFAAFSTIIVAIIGAFVTIIQMKHKTAEATDEARKAKDAALKAQENTNSISNGFAGDVGRKLDSNERKLDRIVELTLQNNRAIQGHLEWHVDHPPQERI